MIFEWDDSKNKANIAKHGVSFELACKIFQSPILTYFDDRHNYGEERSISLGMAGAAAILVVVHTDRAGVTRIISARRATKNERKQYAKRLQSAYDRQ